MGPGRGTGGDQVSVTELFINTAVKSVIFDGAETNYTWKLGT